MRRTKKKIETTVAEMQSRLEQAEQDVQYLKKVNKELKRIEANLSPLLQYYHGPWIDDRKTDVKLPESSSYSVLAEDPIWNVAQDLNIEKTKILKKIVSSLPT